MKVLHLIYLAQKDRAHVIGGAERHLLELLPGLVAEGCEVTLIILAWHPGPIVEQIAQEFREGGVTTILIPRSPFHSFFMKYVRSLQCWLRALKEIHARRNQIIHLHLDVFFLPILSVLAGVHRGVFTFHNDEPWFTKLYVRGVFRVWRRAFQRYIAISSRVKEHCVKMFSMSERDIELIHYGLALPQPYLQRCTREEFGIPSDSFVVGFVGRLVSQKNVSLLVEAASRLQHLFFVIVGGGPLLEELSAQKATLGVSNLIFVGSIPKGAEAMPLFNIFCLPSRWEGFGLVLIEAMLQGIPVLGSSAGAIPEIIGDAGLLFPSDDLEALVGKLLWAESHAQELNELADKGRERARTYFSRGAMVKKTVALYKELQ